MGLRPDLPLSQPPDSAQALKNVGNELRAIGDLQGAANSYRRALGLAPDYLAALYNLGLVLHEADELEEAEACFRRLLAAEPHDTEALFHLGAVLQRTGRIAEAGQMFRRALEHDPNDPHLWIRMGEIGIATGAGAGLREATRCFTRAAELRPDLAEAHSSLGCAFDLAGRHADALRSFREALARRPDDPLCLANVLAQMQQICDWSGFDELCARLRAGIRANGALPLLHPFGMLSIPSTLAEQLACARAYSGTVARDALHGSRSAPRRHARPTGGSGRRLRVGYLSADFHEHVTAHVMVEVFELHDRRRVETFAYSYGPAEPSSIRSRLEHAFEHFVDLRQASDREAAAAIRADGIDILVDLKGYTRDARPAIVALRPAPVQVSYLGFPATMGAGYIDYIISDRFVLPPESQPFFSEHPAYLPGSYYPSNRGRPIAPSPQRGMFGLPPTGFVFCCFNQAYKIVPEVFGVWMRLLGTVTGSVLWLLESNGSAADNLRKEAAKQGIDPGRLIFAPKTSPDVYLSRLQAADLFLDTLPYNAHTTASDALWVGLPVVTCPGDTLPSRVAGSQLHALGLTELIADSLARYEAIALRLARAPGELAELRRILRARRATTSLFDTPSYVRHLEAAFFEMWQRYLAHQAPGVIEI